MRSVCIEALISITFMGMLSPGCGSPLSPSIPEYQTTNETQSIEAAKIQKTWEEQVEQYRAKLNSSNRVNKGSVREEFTILENLLHSASVGVADSELSRILQSKKPYEQMSVYEQVFIQLHIANYSREGQRDKVVEIISKKCPRYVGYAPVEMALTNGKKAENLIAFFEAYDKATNEDTKQQILRVLKSVFPDLQKKHANNVEFVEASKQWILANQFKLKINTNYSPDSLIPESRRFFLP